MCIYNIYIYIYIYLLQRSYPLCTFVKFILFIVSINRRERLLITTTTGFYEYLNKLTE